MTIQDVVERLRKAKRVGVFTHQRPDPDALGSQAAAAWILEEMGAEVIELLQFGEVPPPYRFLLQGAPGELRMWGSEWAGSGGGVVDTILCVDTCTYGQMEPATNLLKGEREKVLAIDHHVTRDDLGMVYADTTAPACVEILWQVAKAARVRLDAGGGKLAEALMAGLVADTGWFRFDSVTRRTHEMAGELCALVPGGGAGLYQKLAQMERKNKLGLMERALRSVRWGFGDRVAVMVLTLKDFAEVGAKGSETEGLVDMPMMVEGVEVVGLLTEMEGGRVRGSLRSKRNVDVNKICAEFGGGGHAKAAGLRVDGPMERAVEEVMGAVGRAMTNGEMTNDK